MVTYLLHRRFSNSIKREIILDKITVQLSCKVKPHSTLKMFIRYFVALCAVAFCAVAINAEVEAEAPAQDLDTQERANPVSITHTDSLSVDN